MPDATGMRGAADAAAAVATSGTKHAGEKIAAANRIFIIAVVIAVAAAVATVIRLDRNTVRRMTHRMSLLMDHRTCVRTVDIVNIVVVVAVVVGRNHGWKRRHPCWTNASCRIGGRCIDTSITLLSPMRMQFVA